VTRPRGVALLAAVLVVALATILIAGLLDRAGLGQARALQSTRAAQAQAYQQGLELWAARILRDDGANDGADSRVDAWAQPLPPITVPEGVITGRMRDLDGCLNLNGLWHDGSEDATAIARLERLLAFLELDPGLLDAIVDWLDEDDRSRRGGGAEDAAYAALDPPRRAGNGPFVHVSELRAVAGVDAEVWQALAPHVCARPDPASALNINTASALVLRSLHPDIDAALAQRLYSDGQARFPSVDAFAQALSEAGLVQPLEGGGQGLGVTSRWFVAEAQIVLGDVPVNLYSLLERRPEDGLVVVHARSQGRY
jgi:general secretion pathway protein K